MKKTNEFLQAHVRSQPVVVIFCAAGTDRSFFLLTAQLGLYLPSVLHVVPTWPRAGLPTTVQTGNPAKSSLIPASHGTNLCLANVIGHGAVDRPSGVVVPRTCASSSLAHQSFIVLRIHGLPLRRGAPAFQTRPVALAVTRGSLCPSSR